MTPRRVSQSDEGFHGVHSDESSGDDSSYAPIPLTLTKRRRKSSFSHASNKANHPHIVTKHNYHDHSVDTVCDVVHENAPHSSRATSGKGGTTMPFPVKLYQMLIQVEEEGRGNVVSWQPHGRCFVVHDPQAFKLLLPNFFKLSKIASFQRQLNLYGFQRLTVGVDKGGYYNELFLRNRPDLVLKIHRVKVKGTGVRAKSNPKEEPNLYLYPAVDELAVSVIAKVQGGSNETAVPSAPHMLAADIVPRDLSPRAESVDSDKYSDASYLYNRSGSSGPVFANPAFDSRHETNAVRLQGLAAQFRDGSTPSVEVVVPPPQQPDYGKQDGWDVGVLKSELSFDRLIDEMFSHNQSLDFSDLLKLASA